MSLNPIIALDHVIEEYRDRALRSALETELDLPLFLSQEPFYQAHHPFGTEPWNRPPSTPHCPAPCSYDDAPAGRCPNIRTRGEILMLQKS
jgi:hypothetical protein